MNTELREAVERIKGGDKVTARFADGPLGEFTVTGSAYEDASGWLRMAGYFFKTRDGEPTRWLVAIEAHEPAQPPVPPEPTGDYLLREPSGQVSVPVGGGVLNRQDDAARLYWDTLWHYHGADLKVYRPEPSPERIEELIRKHLNRWCDDGDVVQATLRGFVADLLGGA
jgi:hypothetical protein